MTDFLVVGNGTSSMPLWPLNGSHSIHVEAAARAVNLDEHGHGGPGWASWEAMCAESQRLNRERQKHSHRNEVRVRGLLPHQRCLATTRRGRQCKNRRHPERTVCRLHLREQERRRYWEDEANRKRQREKALLRHAAVRERLRAVNTALESEGMPVLGAKTRIAELERAEAWVAAHVHSEGGER